MQNGIRLKNTFCICFHRMLATGVLPFYFPITMNPLSLFLSVLFRFESVPGSTRSLPSIVSLSCYYSATFPLRFTHLYLFVIFFGSCSNFLVVDFWKDFPLVVHKFVSPSVQRSRIICDAGKKQNRIWRKSNGWERGKREKEIKWGGKGARKRKVNWVKEK